MKKEVISSPIRWAGSKKKLLNEMLEKMFVKDKNNYVEVFLGSGVVLLNVLNNAEYFEYKKYYVNDINSNIINFYLLLKKDVNYVITKLKLVEEQYNSLNINQKEDFYYKTRDKFNSLPKDDSQKAMYFYFLMKTGYNGVYRENKMGHFNVPFGKKETFIVPDKHLKEVASLIQKVEFYNLDYSEFLEKMKKRKILKDAFIYCDPPYIPEELHVNQKQELYTNDSFNHLKFIDKIVDIKCDNVMISMASSNAASVIYNKKEFYEKDVSKIIRTVNPKKIFNSNEIAYINYDLDFDNLK